jgi:hypothetical protein
MFRDLIERMEVSKDLTADMAAELMRIVPTMAINAPRIISTLISAGMPSVDAEDGTWNIINLIRVISTVYGSNPVSEAINTLAERKRNSANAVKPRKKKSGKDAFDVLALEIWSKNKRAPATRIWGQMVKRIESQSPDEDLFIDDGKICLAREGRAPRRIAKLSFPAILSKIKKL